jgi:hypothetical protein
LGIEKETLGKGVVEEELIAEEELWIIEEETLGIIEEVLGIIEISGIKSKIIVEEIEKLLNKK